MTSNRHAADELAWANSLKRRSSRAAEPILILWLLAG
jgi:hypothetical protein